MSAHTPGPWPIKGWSAGDSQGWQIRLGTDDCAQRIDVYDENQSSEADARLIAAAPDLLAALKAYQDANRIHNDTEGELFELGLAAIAKAEGKS